MKGKITVLNIAGAMKALDNQLQKAEDHSLEVLQYAGESFVRAARENRQFKDQTGNLQSSIGYVIAKDRKIILQSFQGLGNSKTKKGEEAGLRLAKAVLINVPTGWALIGVAGMEYGIYVEAMGKDVITGSIPETRKIIREVTREL